VFEQVGAQLRWTVLHQLYRTPVLTLLAECNGQLGSVEVTVFAVEYVSGAPARQRSPAELAQNIKRGVVESWKPAKVAL
jgi:hypothetical protein